MSLGRNLFPHDFKYWHDVRINEYKTKQAELDAQQRKELYDKFSSIAKKYLPLQRELKDAYIVVIAKSPADLKKEGEILHHCVGSMEYEQKVIQEQSLIFFLRTKDNPQQPFVTVEYSPSKHQILQCYLARNSKPEQEVINYIENTWLPYANRKLQPNKTTNKGVIMKDYFRITGYCKEQNIRFIVDSYGYYEHLWQLSSELVQKGVEIIAVSDSNKFLNGNITWTDCDKNNLIVRATADGKPTETTFTEESVTYKALKVGDKIYVPDKSVLS